MSETPSKEEVGSEGGGYWAAKVTKTETRATWWFGPPWFRYLLCAVLGFVLGALVCTRHYAAIINKQNWAYYDSYWPFNIFLDEPSMPRPEPEKKPTSRSHGLGR